MGHIARALGVSLVAAQVMGAHAQETGAASPSVASVFAPVVAAVGVCVMVLNRL
jgi:hypothetical protein